MEYMLWVEIGPCAPRRTQGALWLFSDVTAIPQSEALFFDEDGATLSTSLAATVSATSAKEALAHWLAIGQATTALLWS